MEENSLDTVKMHLRHFAKTVGNGFPIQTLSTIQVQQHIDRRARKKGLRKRPLSPMTLKKEVTSLRACWNWGLSAGLLVGTFPNNKALKYPKGDAKPHFQTWKEIERKIARGGLSAAEIKDLWDCLFLTLNEINELLSFVEETARHDFLYPMFVFVAHTGARRSEMLRALIDDVDFDGQTVLLRERKRSREQRTFRRVPLSPLLERVLRDWIGRHPGGPSLFCLGLDVPRSKKHRQSPGPLTRDEAHDHFVRAVAHSKWDVLRGWHVFRHSFVSNCAARGVDQRLIDDWVGHQTEAMRKRYRHLFPDQQRHAIQTVFGEMGDAVPVGKEFMLTHSASDKNHAGNAELAQRGTPPGNDDPCPGP
ncbi:MAG: site-specific integrase [Planctomycetes bacterium]|nr:site-specific integrase [Planctomycetota bacterium]